MPIIVENVNYTYMQGSSLAFQALTDVNFTIKEGEYWGLIGHTGSGKSTLVQHFNGLVQPTSGKVTVDGYDMSVKQERIKGRRLVGMVFQYPEYQLFEETVAKDIAYGPLNMGLDPAEVESRVEEAMQLVGLAPKIFKNKSPFELSGGEKRRVALAGIIAMRPKYLVLDEPMAGLDPSGRRGILELISRLRERTGCAVVMVSHSMDDVAKTVDRIAVLSGGTLVKTGTPAEIFGDPTWLTSIGLDIPQASRLAAQLKLKGIDLPDGLYTVEALHEYLKGRLANV